MVSMSTDVSIRVAGASDAEKVMSWFNDETTRRWIPIPAIPISLRAEQELLSANGESDYLLFIIEHPTYGEIGLTGLHQMDKARGWSRSVTVIGDRKARGQGFALGARQQVMDFAFMELGICKISSVALACNTPALQLIRRTGGVLEGLRQREFYRSGSWHDLIDFGTFANVGEAVVPRVQRIPTPVNCTCGRSYPARTLGQ
jgi:RimJ/RimL family protein N-acetyltransferase